MFKSRHENIQKNGDTTPHTLELNVKWKGVVSFRIDRVTLADRALCTHNVWRCLETDVWTIRTKYLYPYPQSKADFFTVKPVT
jgi:hypothetical protein